MAFPTAALLQSFDHLSLDDALYATLDQIRSKGQARVGRLRQVVTNGQLYLGPQFSQTLLDISQDEEQLRSFVSDLSYDWPAVPIEKLLFKSPKAMAHAILDALSIMTVDASLLVKALRTFDTEERLPKLIELLEKLNPAILSNKWRTVCRADSRSLVIQAIIAYPNLPEIEQVKRKIPLCYASQETISTALTPFNTPNGLKFLIYNCLSDGSFDPSPFIPDLERDSSFAARACRIQHLHSYPNNDTEPPRSNIIGVRESPMDKRDRRFRELVTECEATQGVPQSAVRV